ncbi:MAG: hypothetical protein ABR594_08530, partial [Pyrinomonadaceae bacterium]
MKTIAISIAAFVFLIFNAFAQQPDYSQLKTEAEAQYAQGSYARANEIYSRVDKTRLNAQDVRWVDFRLADTSWRAQASTETSDTTKFEVAQKQLEELIRAIDKEENRDLVWAEGSGANRLHLHAIRRGANAAGCGSGHDGDAAPSVVW